MSNFRQAIHNLLRLWGRAAGPTGAAAGHTLADELPKTKGKSHLQTIIAGLGAAERRLALVAMAESAPKHRAASWTGPLIEELRASEGRKRREFEFAAWVRLVYAWMALSESEREFVMRVGDGLPSEMRRLGLAAAMTDPDPEVRCQALEYVRVRGETVVDEVVIGALADPNLEVVREAEVTAQARFGEEDAESALRLAAERFELHQSRVVAQAVLARADLAGVDGPAWRAMEATGAGRSGLIRAMRSGASETGPLRAWERLATPWLVDAAADRLSGRWTTAERERMLEWSHLSLRPLRQAALAGLSATRRGKIVAGLGPGNAAGMNTLSAGAWVGMARTLRELGADAGMRERMARATLYHPSAEVRFAGWRASPIRSSADFAADAHAGVARSAALSATEREREAFWTGLMRSEHAEVRAIAISEVERRGIVWSERAGAVLGLRRRFAEDAAAVEASWRSAMEGADERMRGVLVRLAARIGFAADVAPILAALVRADGAEGSGEARVAAAAVTALAGRDDAALEAGLAAKDARVRANAIESAHARMGEAWADRILELKGDPHHRPRSSAIRALTRSGKLSGRAMVEAAAEMLVDVKGATRLAGAWLAERALAAGGLLDACERARLGVIVERRAEGEAEEAVRRRLAASVMAWAVAEGEEGAVAGVLTNANEIEGATAA